MTENAETLKGVVFNLAGHIDYADGSVVSKILLKKDIGNITLFSFDAGQGLSEHMAPFDAVVQILDGQAEITIGGEKHKVKAGEMLIMPANVPHALHAPEKFKMLLIMIRGGVSVGKKLVESIMYISHLSILIYHFAFC